MSKEHPGRSTRTCPPSRPTSFSHPGDFCIELRFWHEHLNGSLASSSKPYPRTETMRISFPHSLSIGTDIIRLSRLFKSPHTFRKLVLRILQPVEQQVFFERFGTLSIENAPEHSITERKRHEWLGGRWAAKEAAKKAWGASLLSFKDLRIETAPDGDIVVVCALLGEGSRVKNLPSRLPK